MAYILTDGFNFYNGTGTLTGLQAKWTLGATTGFSLVAAPFAGQAVRMDGGGGASSFMNRQFTAAASSFTAHFWWKFTTLPTSDSQPNQQIQFASGTTRTVGIRVNSVGAILLYRASGTTMTGVGALLGTSASGLVVAAADNHWAVEVVVHDTLGRISVYLNGASTATYEVTNVDTNNAVTTCDNMFYGMSFGSGVPGDSQISHIHITDSATRLADQHYFEPIRATADTATKAFTASTGTDNYAMVDDTTVNTTDYVQASAINNLDLYTFGNLATTPASIAGVNAVIFGLKTDATVRAVAAVIDVSAVQLTSNNLTLATTTVSLTQFFPTKPAGGAWDTTAVNGITAGPKVTV